jgi:hypothetical protein
MQRRTIIQSSLALVGVLATLALSPALALGSSPQWYDNGGLLGTAHLPVIAWGEIELESGAVGKINCMNVMNLSVWNEGGQGHGQFEGWGTNACKAPELEETLEKAYEQPIKEGLIKSPLSVFASSELPLRVEYREGITCKERSKTQLSQCSTNPSEERITSKELILNNGLHRRADSFPWKILVGSAIREEEEVPVPKIGVAPAGESCYPTEGGHPTSWEKVPSGCVRITIICPQVPAEVVFYGSLEPSMLNGVKNGLSPSRLQFGAQAGKLISSEGEAPETVVAKEMKLDGMNGVELIQLR